MAEPSRYSVGGDEADILKNKLGITDLKTLEDTETLLLSDAYNHFFEKLETRGFIFNLELLFDIHRFFLGNLYSWAGRTRTVEISKGGILFSPSSQIEVSLHGFEKILKKNLPQVNESKRSLSKKLAAIHCEFNAIHPFREGNGRTIRLFLDLIAVHSGFNVINFGKKDIYIRACIEGMTKGYARMERVIYSGLNKIKPHATNNS